MKTNILVTVIAILILLSIGYNVIQQKTKGGIANATSSIIPKAKVEVIADWSNTIDGCRVSKIDIPHSTSVYCIEFKSGGVSCLYTH